MTGYVFDPSPAVLQNIKGANRAADLASMARRATGVKALRLAILSRHLLRAVAANAVRLGDPTLLELVRGIAVYRATGCFPESWAEPEGKP